MTIDNKILIINRHLFDYGTNKLNRVLRSFVPRGSTPRLRWMQGSWMSNRLLICYNEKVKNRALMLKLKLSLQVKGYRLDISSNLT
jgi:hypothetical protein